MQRNSSVPLFVGGDIQIPRTYSSWFTLIQHNSPKSGFHVARFVQDRHVPRIGAAHPALIPFRGVLDAVIDAPSGLVKGS